MTFKKSTGYAGDRQRTFYGKYKIIIPKEEPMSYEEFRKNASNDLIRKFDTDCSKYSEDGHSDNYFYANCKYWENKLKEEPKQETLEEFIKDVLGGYDEIDFSTYESFIIAGAKWQSKQLFENETIQTLEKCIELLLKKQEKTYSEEEVLELLNKREDYINSEDDIFNYKSNKEWFKQFKKK